MINKNFDSYQFPKFFMCVFHLKLAIYFYVSFCIFSKKKIPKIDVLKSIKSAAASLLSAFTQISVFMVRSVIQVAINHPLGLQHLLSTERAPGINEDQLPLLVMDAQ